MLLIKVENNYKIPYQMLAIRPMTALPLSGATGQRLTKIIAAPKRSWRSDHYKIFGFTEPAKGCPCRKRSISLVEVYSLVP